METKNDLLGGCPVSFSESKFNFELFTTSIVVGGISCGKTTFIINKIYRDICDKIDNLYVFSNNHDSNITLYNQITNKIFEFKDFEFIFSVIKSDNVKKGSNSLIIFDDLSTTNITKNPAIMELIVSSRIRYFV